MKTVVYYKISQKESGKQSKKFYIQMAKKFISRNVMIFIFKNKTVYVAGQEIKVLIKHRDTYAKEALKNEVKMCRIKRKWHKNSWRYYVDIVLDGEPPKKHKTANGTVGIDIGPSTIAVDSENGSILEELGKDVNSIERELRVINRKIDRQRRANNPENYNPDGTIRKKYQNLQEEMETFKVSA